MTTEKRCKHCRVENLCFDWTICYCFCFCCLFVLFCFFFSPTHKIKSIVHNLDWKKDCFHGKIISRRFDRLWRVWVRKFRTYFLSEYFSLCISQIIVITHDWLKRSNYVSRNSSKTLKINSNNLSLSSSNIFLSRYYLVIVASMLLYVIVIFHGYVEYWSPQVRLSADWNKPNPKLKTGAQLLITVTPTISIEMPVAPNRKTKSSNTNVFKRLGKSVCLVSDWYLQTARVFC